MCLSSQTINPSNCEECLRLINTTTIHLLKSFCNQVDKITTLIDSSNESNFIRQIQQNLRYVRLLSECVEKLRLAINGDQKGGVNNWCKRQVRYCE